MKRETESLGSVAEPDWGVRGRQRGRKVLWPTASSAVLGRFRCSFYPLKGDEIRCFWGHGATTIRHASFLSPLDSVEA